MSLEIAKQSQLGTGQKVQVVVGDGGGGGGGMWAGAFGNVVVKKIWPTPPPFGTKLTDPPLNEG